jgi:5S rRNA maturation endonuclease (ribonuclease M5)
MPNRHAVKMMKGSVEDLDGVLFVEGITDFIKVSSEAEKESIKLAVLGGTSGSFGSVGKLNIPEGVDVFVGTDPDAKGDEYARTIQMQLGSRVCYRLPLAEVEGGEGERP